MSGVALGLMYELLEKLSNFKVSNQLLNIKHISQFPSSEYDFSWLSNIIDNSMEEYLLEYLTSNPPNLNQYIYNDAEEHFIDTKYYIRLSLVDRQEILDIINSYMVFVDRYIRDMAKY